MPPLSRAGARSHTHPDPERGIEVRRRRARTIRRASLLRLQPGDILVYETGGPLAADTGARLSATLKKTLAKAGHPEVPVLVVGEGHILTARVTKSQPQ